MAVEATMPTTVVSAAASNTDKTTTTTSSTTSTGLADNFQTFLTLLTTQLQNQNPLDPLDTNQFTQQLVQFAGVEQQLKSNEQLKALLATRKERAIDQCPDLCRQHRRRRRQHPEVRRLRNLEPEGREERDRRDHHHEFDRTDGLFRQLYAEPGQCQLRVGRQGQ